MSRSTEPGLVAPALSGRTLTLVLLAMVLGGLAAAMPGACSCLPAMAHLKRIEHRTELIGGPRALGEVGDFLFKNDQIRVIVQDTGFSRGFGVFGGSLIDADLIRPGAGFGNSVGGDGHDNFGEMFPAFFLEALEPTEIPDPNTEPGAEAKKLKAIEIENDGTDGEPAVLVVRGSGADFLALTEFINEALLGDDRDAPALLFENRYILRPGARYIEIETKVQNYKFSDEPLEFNGGEDLLGLPVPTPFGDVMLFGAGNHVFLPHEAGYDLRYTLEDLYASNQYELPALPGLVADFIASTGPDVSYGLLSAPPEVWDEETEGFKPDDDLNYPNSTGQFPEAKGHSVHVPFIASAFTGVFQVLPPVLQPNDRKPGGPDEFTFRRYFIVGSGDVASVSDVVYELLGTPTGTLTGIVRDRMTKGPPAHGSIIVVDRKTTKKVTQIDVDGTGRFKANLPAGDYDLVLVIPGHDVAAPKKVKVSADRLTFAELRAEPPADIVVHVNEPGVGGVPAKVTLVGVIDQADANRDTKEFLFDLSVGEPWRFTDLEPDTPRAETRRYIEDFAYTRDGSVRITARPGRYTVYVGRGAEYTRYSEEVRLTAGHTTSVSATIEKVLDTPGYISADFHLHSIFSLDSFADLESRIASYSGEGVEYVVSTDHNFVVDYAPTILEMGLEQHIGSAIGLELTTIDRGHFNGFPLRLGDGALIQGEDGSFENTIASRTYGSFQWHQRNPDDIFDALRAQGVLGDADPDCAAENLLDPDACDRPVQDVIVQVNHPRDSILGYFDQYAVNPDTLEPEGVKDLLFGPDLDRHPEFQGANFSYDFDAIEVFNGKRFEFLHTLRVPEGVATDPVSCCPVTTGNIFRELPEFDCDPDLRDCTCTPDDVNAQLADDNCDAGDIAFPGVIEDWFAILNTGKRVTGTGNSDSHSPHKEEPGYPKNYVAVDDDTVREVTPADIVAGLQAGNALMTNGPFIEVSLEDKGMGETVNLNGASATTLEVRVQTAPWAGIDKINVYLSGALVAERSLADPSAADDVAQVHEESFELDVDQDGWVVVEVSGDTNLFPSVFPNEIPPLQFTDVLGAIGGAFGLGAVEGAIEPDLTFQTTPYALTNPIYIDADGDGEVTPIAELPLVGDAAGSGDDGEEARVASGVEAPLPPGAFGGPDLTPRESLDHNSPVLTWYLAQPVRKQRVLRRLPPWLWPTDRPADARRVLVQFMRHNH